MHVRGMKIHTGFRRIPCFGIYCRSGMHPTEKRKTMVLMSMETNREKTSIIKNDTGYWLVFCVNLMKA